MTIFKLYFICVKYPTLQNAHNKADTQPIQPVCVIKTDIQQTVGTAMLISLSKVCYLKRHLYLTSSKNV